MPLPLGLGLCAEHDRISDHAIEFQEMLMDSIKARRAGDHRQERHHVEVRPKRRYSSEYRDACASRVRFAKPIATYNDETNCFQAAPKTVITPERRRRFATSSPTQMAEDSIPRYISRRKPILYQNALTDTQNGHERKRSTCSSRQASVPLLDTRRWQLSGCVQG